MDIKKFKFKKYGKGDEKRWMNDYIEFYPLFSYPRFSFIRYGKILKISFCFIYGVFYIVIPMKKVRKKKTLQFYFYFYSLDSKIPESFWYCFFSDKLKSFEFPWVYNFHKSYLLGKNNIWNGFEKNEWLCKTKTKNRSYLQFEDIIYHEKFNYCYELENVKQYYNIEKVFGNKGLICLKDKKNNEICCQKAIATVTIEKIEKRQNWLMWTSFHNKISYFIYLEFNKALGESSNCTGIYCPLKKNESPEEAVRRLEKEFKM